MYKVCKKCGRIYPATTDYFFKSMNVKSGLRSKCKKCHTKQTDNYLKSEARKQYTESLYARMNAGELLGYRECSTCKRIYPASLEYFFKAPAQYLGLRSKCKKCMTVESATSKQKPENKERANRTSREYYYKHRAEASRRYKEYYQCRREYHLERAKEYRRNNIEKYKAYDRSYVINNRDKVRLKWIRKGHRRRARERETEVHYTLEQWAACLDFFGHSCAYCGASGVPLQKEHFVPVTSGGDFTINNIIPVCGSCNSSKQARSFYDWYPKQAFYRKTRHNKITKYLNIAGTVQQASLFL